MFARDENGEVIVYVAQCDTSPELYDRISLNRIEQVRGADGHVTRGEVTTIWEASVADRSRPVALPERLPALSAPPGMVVDTAAVDPVLDVDAHYRLVAFGERSVIAVNFVMSDLRRISGQFDLEGRRFDEPSRMLAYACSDAFADAWLGS